MADPESREVDTEGDEHIVSMVDVLNDEQQLQDDANAVLGACDDTVCTYSQVTHPSAIAFTLKLVVIGYVINFLCFVRIYNYLKVSLPLSSSRT